jgi:hypothetical protein
MTMATTNTQGQPPAPRPSNIPAPGTLPKLPQTIFILETDDRGASTVDPSRPAS